MQFVGEEDSMSVSVTDIPNVINKIEETVGIQLSPLTDYILANLNQGKLQQTNLY